MRLVVSIISHGHDNLIINLGLIKILSSFENINVICRDNLSSNALKRHCEKNNATYIRNNTKKGFSENNNLNFIFYCENFGYNGKDFFLIVNPDIFIDKINMSIFINEIIKKPNSIQTGNLFLDKDYLTPDHNVRYYPKFVDFFSSYFLNRNATIFEKSADFNSKPIWSSGAFMAISTENYLELNGLDEIYFMYCEDIDFCRRAIKHNININVIMDARIVHMRSRDSKIFGSKFFWWHVSSTFKYLFSRNKLQPKRSSISEWKIKQSESNIKSRRQFDETY